MRKLADFKGRWRISRRIEAGGASGSGLFDGIAVFTGFEGGLTYKEAGELRLPEQSGMQASREYIWREGAGGVDVCFEDGSDFHHIDLASNVVTAWHDCHPDFYEVSYNFTHWPNWRAIWRVRGPAKDYTMITDYCR